MVVRGQWQWPGAVFFCLMLTCHICPKESVHIWLTAASNLSVPCAVPILSTVSLSSHGFGLHLSVSQGGSSSQVTWINDSSTGFTAQPHPLHKPARSAPFLTLTAQHRTEQRRSQITPLTSLSHPLALLRHKAYGGHSRMSPLFNLRLCSERWILLAQKLPESRWLQACFPDPTCTESKKRQYFCCPSKGSNCPQKSQRSDSAN